MRLGVLIFTAAGLGTAALAAAWASTIKPDLPPTAIVSQKAVQPSERIFLADSQLGEARSKLGHGREVRSILNITEPMRYGDFVWNDRNVAAGRLWIRVDPAAQLISVFRGPHEIGTAVILYGAEGNETPAGVFPIQWKKKDHRSSTYDAPMPYTLRLTDDGVAIHGSDVKWGAATHGCIGLPMEFAERLFQNANQGDEVVIAAHSSRGPNSPPA